MSYNDYGDYGDEPRRAGRRAATREPAGPSKVQGSTAAAILVFVAIVGFGIGALIGSSGGDDGQATTTTEQQDGAPLGSPDDAASGSPSDAAGGDTTDEGNDGESDDQTNAATDPSEGDGIAVSSPEDGGTVPSGEDGRIHFQGSTDPPLADTELIIERSLDGGATWEDAGSGPVTVETDGSGNFTTNLWSGRETENMYRVVSQDGQLASNTISVNVVPPDEYDDNSGSGEGDDD